MLRFPLRLTADLTMARLAQRWRPALSPNPIQFVDAAELLHHDSTHPVSHEKIREVISSRSPAVWIGGSEPLHHPGTAHLVRAITGSGHFVFLETDGTLLRRRIHEFQPVSRLFLAVRLEPAAQGCATKALQADAWKLAAEGIRAARLSGFMICVHARIDAETELPAMDGLIQYAHSLDVDGIVITSAKTAPQRKTAEARKLIGSKWWESFSRLIEPVLSAVRDAVQSIDETVVRLEQQAPVSEEGVKVA